MAQVSHRIRDAVLYAVAESTFGTDPGSGHAQCYPVWDSVKIGPKQDELPNLEMRTDLYDRQNTVRGNKGGEFEFKAYLRPDTSQLTVATTMVTPWLGTLLKFGLGAEFPANGAATIGSAITTATSATSVIIAGGGAKFSKGTWALGQVAGAYEPVRIINIATDTLTLNPGFSATPSVAAFLQMHNHAPARGMSTSFALRFAQAGHASLQWSLSGCKMDSIAFDFAMGEMPSATFKGQAKSWIGPSALGYAAVAGTNGMASPFVVKDAFLILQSSATATRAHYPLETAALETDLGLAYVTDLGGVSGASGVVRTTGRDFAKMKLKTRPDVVASAIEQDATWWANQTDLQAVLAIATGSGTSKRWMLADMPTCNIVGKPERAEASEGLAGFEFELVSKMSSVVTSPTEGNDFHRAPLVYAFG